MSENKDNTPVIKPAYYTLGSMSEPEGLTLVCQQEADGETVGGFDPDKLYKKKRITSEEYAEYSKRLSDESTEKGAFGLVNKTGAKAFSKEKEVYRHKQMLLMIIKHEFAIEELMDMVDDGVDIDKVKRRSLGRNIHPDVFQYVLDTGYDKALKEAKKANL